MEERIITVKHRTSILILAAVVVSALSSLASAQVTVFDPFNYKVNKEQVRRHWEVIERLDKQIENQLLILENWEFTRLAPMLEAMKFVRAPLDDAAEIFGDTDLNGALEAQYPIDPAAYANRDATDMAELRRAWLASQRASVALARTVQNRVYSEMEPTQTRIDEYVAQSNVAPGPTAATQAGNEIIATLIAQLQAVHAREIADTRAELEREAEAQAEEAFARQRREHLMRDWNRPHNRAPSTERGVTSRRQK
jgi:conjugal transfer/entry exclusion protein